MRVDRPTGNAKHLYEVDVRAHMIRNPVAKLRYLQGAMAAEAAPKQRPRWTLRRFGPVLLAAMVLVPLPTVSDSFVPPQALTMPTINAGPATLAQPSVWLVEDSASYEVYSNGLRIENNHAVGNNKRLYPVYNRESLELIEWRSGPVGILYHTSESQLAPFNRAHNKRLRRVGKWLLEYIQRKRAYHFVIDRFGRVHRIVRETDSADHSGYSVWADSRHVYVNLNPSFLGVSFETETQDSSEGPAVNHAQVRAARVLTEMLRSKYGIRAENCVTHAQVSVFSRALRLGNHVDWAANFPYAELGLGDNYGLPLAAIAVFGFDYGTPFVKATGPEFWRGIAMGEDALRQGAAMAGMPVSKYKTARKRRYREILKTIEESISTKEFES